MDYLQQIDALWSRGIKCPVETLEDLDRLDSDEIVSGYRSFRADDPEPGNNHSRAYWHGWCNASADFRQREGTSAQSRLCKMAVERGDFLNMFNQG